MGLILIKFPASRNYRKSIYKINIDMQFSENTRRSLSKVSLIKAPRERNSCAKKKYKYICMYIAESSLHTFTRGEML